jgi:predicted nucleic acid-binding protein
VILVDANILLYASNAEADQHAESRNWLDSKLDGARRSGCHGQACLHFFVSRRTQEHFAAH